MSTFTRQRFLNERQLSIDNITDVADDYGSGHRASVFRPVPIKKGLELATSLKESTHGAINSLDVDAKCLSAAKYNASGKILHLELMVYTTILAKDVDATIDLPEIVYKRIDGTIQCTNAASMSTTQLGLGRQYLSIFVETSNDAIRNINDVLTVDFKVATSDGEHKKRVSVLPCGPRGHS